MAAYRRNLSSDTGLGGLAAPRVVVQQPPSRRLRNAEHEGVRPRRSRTRLSSTPRSSRLAGLAIAPSAAAGGFETNSMTGTPLRILIVNPFGIGDVLFSTPLVRAVRRAFPHSYLAYVCNRRTEQILRHNTNLDELFVYEKDELIALWRRDRILGLRTLASLLQQIRARRFTMAVDLSLGERYSFLLSCLGVSKRVGFNFRHRGRFLTHRVAIKGYEDQHVVEYYAELLAHVGVRMLDRQLELAVQEIDGRAAQERLAGLSLDGHQPVIGLVPAGGISWGMEAHFRRWPKERFVWVGRALASRYGARILVFGETNDQPICAEISRAIGPAAVDLSGQTTLGQFVGLLGRCALVVSNDGGPVHIAASQQVKTVSIFGPVDPQVYGPYPRTSQHRIVYKDELRCRPCYHRFKLPPCPYERACLTELTADEVLEACTSLLEAGTP